MGRQQGAPSQAGGSGVTQAAVSPQAPHRLSWLPAFSCLSSPNTSFGGCISREALVKREEEKKRKADNLAETTAHHPSCIAG